MNYGIDRKNDDRSMNFLIKAPRAKGNANKARGPRQGVLRTATRQAEFGLAAALLKASRNQTLALADSSDLNY